MKSDMFESYTEALGFLVFGALLSGLIVFGLLEIIWRLV